MLKFDHFDLQFTIVTSTLQCEYITQQPNRLYTFMHLKLLSVD